MIGHYSVTTFKETNPTSPFLVNSLLSLQAIKEHSRINNTITTLQRIKEHSKLSYFILFSRCIEAKKACIYVGKMKRNPSQRDLQAAPN